MIKNVIIFTSIFIGVEEVNTHMNDYYNNNFFTRVKRTVYKWWCVVYKPVYKLVHHGEWPDTKEPGYLAEKQELAKQMASQSQTAEQYEPSIQIPDEPVINSESEVDLSGVNDDVLSRANEIMERLAREAAEDEAKKQAEIDAAKQKAENDARLASILKSTERDISAYIAEGIAHRADNETTNIKEA